MLLFITNEFLVHTCSTQPASILRRQWKKTRQTKEIPLGVKENSDKGIISFDSINHHEPLSFSLFASTPHKNI